MRRIVCWAEEVMWGENGGSDNVAWTGSLDGVEVGGSHERVKQERSGIRVVEIDEERPVDQPSPGMKFG